MHRGVSSDVEQSVNEEKFHPLQRHRKFTLEEARKRSFDA
jgi:hypothetical protein